MKLAPLLVVVTFFLSVANAEPVLLDKQFKLPPNFHIYKVADASLCGGSYDITFDGQGRLLVGDGKAVRRLTDSNGDRVYDKQEVIAEGLGGRGPQGLLVYGDRLYAVGGDGIQLFSGYEGDGPLKHEGRLGQPFNTGGDHTAHTVLRGLDGYVYFVCGEGGGVNDRKHITEESSPVIFERNASVFRFDPDGEYWECISAGGRNPPSLGMNYLGEFFSFDSDMEWHVDLPWYRPVRLNHWAIGGDQGWQGVGAFPPYHIDSVPPVLEVGRGSPNWGIFYEHNQLPEKYADSFLCCDYRWKSATTGGYNSSGRLVTFHMKRDGATWKAEMETLVETIPNAKDEKGQAINFALVDVDVAPDGSLFVSDHNQGVWRIFYAESDSVPAIVPEVELNPRQQALLQPASEWTRLRMQEHFQSAGAEDRLNKGTVGERLRELVLTGPEVRPRHTALRYLAPEFKTFRKSFLAKLAKDSEPEIRAQAAWLYGLRRLEDEVEPTIKLLQDSDPFVRRRAAEALGRLNSEASNEALVNAMDDKVRAVQYAAMTALAHRPTKEWIELVKKNDSAQVRMRGLVASTIRRERPDDETVAWLLARVIDTKLESKTDQLDRLRVFSLFGDVVKKVKLTAVADLWAVMGLAKERDPDLRWEYTRLAGQFSSVQSIDFLLAELADQKTPNVSRFHIAQALSKIDVGFKDGKSDATWTDEEAKRFFDWLVTTQEGWFSEFDTKGRQFPQFWASVLDASVDRHPKQVEAFADQLKPGSQLAKAGYGKLAESKQGRNVLLGLMQSAEEPTRDAIADALTREKSEASMWPMALDRLANKDRRKQLAEWVIKQNATLEQLEAHADELRDESLVGIQLIAHRLVSLLDQRRDAKTAARALDVLFQTESKEQNLKNAAVRLAATEKWQATYRNRFGTPFLSNKSAAKTKLTNEQIHQLVLGKADGDISRGRNIYLQAQCFSCHGGLADKKAAIFGPDLAGVTKRLKPQELADAIVYPSKQVAERFRNTLLVTADGDMYTGVLTEKTDDQMVIVDRENAVHRIAKSDVEVVKTLETSPMPEDLLNRFDEQNVRDLVAFIRSLE